MDYIFVDRFVDENRSQSLLQSVKAVYKRDNPLFSDVTIVVQNEKYLCHKIILGSSSPYFMTLFTTQIGSKDTSEVMMQDIHPATMRLVLDYIYTGEAQMNIDSVQDLLSAANLFQLTCLREGCARFMEQHVNVSNCLGIYFFAKAHECSELARKSHDTILSLFPRLPHEQEFLSLPIDKLTEILSNDNINVASEEEVFQSAITWINYDFDQRSADFSHLMISCVRFANLSRYFFCDRVLSDNLILNCQPVLESLDKVRYYHMLPHRHQEMDLNLIPRAGMNYVRGVIVMANPYSDEADDKYNIMQLLLPKVGKVHYICRLPQGFYMPGCAVTGDNCIYLAGGELRKFNYRSSISSEGYSRLVYMFDDSLMWQPKASMLYSRSHFNLVLVDGVLYAVGGRNGTGLLAAVERYSPHSNSWESVEPLPKPLASYTSVSYKGNLYVFGGETETEITSSTYRYDPGRDSWETLACMKVARALAGSVVFRNKIYVVGGNSSLSSRWRKEALPEHCVSSSEIFDPQTGTWEFGSELPNALCGAGVVKYGDTILTVGGEDDKSWLGGLYWLRPDPKSGGTNEIWSEGAELSSVMSTFACIVANVPSHIIK